MSPHWWAIKVISDWCAIKVISDWCVINVISDWCAECEIKTWSTIQVSSSGTTQSPVQEPTDFQVELLLGRLQEELLFGRPDTHPREQVLICFVAIFYYK